MKKFSLLMCALVLLGAPLRAPAAGDAPGDDVREFYAWYVNTLNESKDVLGTKRDELRKFVTGRLLREIEGMKKGPDGLNGDYFLDAQDWDSEWGKNVTIDKVTVNDASGTVDVTLTGPKVGVRKLKVTVLKKKLRWKIDRVEGR